MDAYPLARRALETIAGAAAEGVARSGRGLRALRWVPIDQKRWLVHRLPLDRLPSDVIAEFEGAVFELELRDDVQRLMYFDAYERSSFRQAMMLVPLNGVCLDVGANIGAYTLPLALKVGRQGTVHTFEPDPANCARLRRNCARNDVTERVVINELALSDSAGTAPLHMADSGQGGHGTLASFGEEWVGVRHVSRTTLDDYLQDRNIEHVDLAKIDVEGHEVALFQGARRSLRAGVIRSLIVEFNGGRLAQEGHSLNDFLSILAGHGYQPAELNWRLLSLMKRGLIPAHRVCSNLLFRSTR